MSCLTISSFSAGVLNHLTLVLIDLERYALFSVLLIDTNLIRVVRNE